MHTHLPQDNTLKMAEATGADLAAGLVHKLVSLATNELIQAWKFHEDLDTLRERFELIGALLNEAHTQNLNMSTAQLWFNKLEQVALLWMNSSMKLPEEKWRIVIRLCSF